MHNVLTFVPSVRLVRQTMLNTSSCQIMVQKSAIVFGFGPFKYISNKYQFKMKLVNEKKSFLKQFTLGGNVCSPLSSILLIENKTFNFDNKFLQLSFYYQKEFCFQYLVTCYKLKLDRFPHKLQFHLGQIAICSFTCRTLIIKYLLQYNQH